MIPTARLLLVLMLAAALGCTATRTPPAASAPVYFQAHRGAVDEAPENTLAALRHAWRFPGAVPEVDVRTTRDGVLICLHDDTLARTTDAVGRFAHTDVAELSYDEVSRWDAGAWFDPAFAGARVPTLSAVFDLLRADPERRLYLDLKAADLDTLDRLIASAGVLEQVLFVHGDPAELAAMRRRYPGVGTMTWLSGPKEAQRRRFEELAEGGFAGLTQLQFHLPAEDTETPIRYVWTSAELEAFGLRLAEAGVVLQVRPFVFDPASLRGLLDAGIRWYVADAPEAFATALRAAQRQTPDRP